MVVTWIRWNFSKMIWIVRAPIAFQLQCTTCTFKQYVSLAIYTLLKIARSAFTYKFNVVIIMCDNFENNMNAHMPHLKIKTLLKEKHSLAMPYKAAIKYILYISWSALYSLLQYSILLSQSRKQHHISVQQSGTSKAWQLRDFWRLIVTSWRM